MTTLLTIIFGVACFAAGISVLAMLHSRAVPLEAREEAGGKRVDLSRRDQVQELIDSSKLLLAHYKFRNWLIVFIFSVTIAVNALGLRSNQHTATKANSAADQANDAIAQIQAERRRNTFRSCKTKHAADVLLNNQNAGLRGFIVNTLPPEIRRTKTIKAYLDTHRVEFPGGQGGGPAQPDRPVQEQPSPAFVIAYLERARRTWPVVKSVYDKHGRPLTTQEVNLRCEQQTTVTVKPTVK